MEFIFEIIMELFVEGGLEMGSNKKISKWIRYPILFLILLLFAVVILGMLLLGILLLQESMLAGIFVTVIGLFMLVGTILKFKNLLKKERK